MGINEGARELERGCSFKCGLCVMKEVIERKRANEKMKRENDNVKHEVEVLKNEDTKRKDAESTRKIIMSKPGKPLPRE